MPKTEEWPHIFDFPETGKWRVKLCRLVEENWIIFDEGDIHGEYDEALDEYRIVVTSSDDVPCVLFRSIIRSPVTFQKQDTMLLWSGPEKDVFHTESEAINWADKSDLARIAIGFQVATGCASISEFVLYANFQLSKEDRIYFTVQQSGGADGNFDCSAGVVERPVVLPPFPNKLNLTIVLNLFSESLTFQLSREFLIVYLDSTQYLNRLWSVFKELRPSEGDAPNTDDTSDLSSAESPLEVIQNLWTISDIVKQYCLVGDSYLLEEMIEADRFSKVLQMLEYDRTFGTRQANFFEYYNEHTALKQVFKLADAPIVEKIHKTFRLQLMRDILVRCADDFAFHILRTLIYVYHSEIVEKLQNTPEFCDNLFGLFDESPYRTANETSSTKDDAIRFIYDIMKTSKTFAYSQLKPLYLTLIDSGLIGAIKYGINSARKNEIKILALESLSILLDFDNSLIAPCRQVILDEIMNLALDQELKPRSLSQIHAARAVNLEIAETSKKLLLDFPTETMQLFFSKLRDYLVTIEENSSMTPMMLVPFLEILTHCFTCHPDISGTLMKKYSIWWHLASILTSSDSSGKAITTQGDALYKPSKIEAGMITVQNLRSKCERQHGSAKSQMALIRLIREAIQPPVTTSTLKCAEQAECIIDSGLFGVIVKSHVRKYMQQSTTRDAEQSSFLNLLYTIVDGENHTSRQQFKVFTGWLRKEGRLETQVLAQKYTFLRCLLNEIMDDWHLEISLKRLQDNQALSETTGHLYQRTRTSVMLTPRRMVDEIETFSNHFPRGCVQKSELVEESQQPSPPRVESIGKLDRIDATEPDELSSNQRNPPSAVFDNTSFRVMSPQPGPYPWWDSRNVQRSLENSG